MDKKIQVTKKAHEEALLQRDQEWEKKLADKVQGYQETLAAKVSYNSATVTVIPLLSLP
jgi:hypothetical protein